MAVSASPPRRGRYPADDGHRPHHWRRDLVELAALFTAVTVADSVAKTVVSAPDGPVLLIISALALLATAALHTWWSHRRQTAPTRTSPAGVRNAGGGEPSVPDTRTTDMSTTLWRMRTTVRDEPGELASLCRALAEHQVDVLSLQTHPLGTETIDEFLLRAPARVEGRELTAAVAAAGGRDTWLARADAHDLVDAPTRALELATRTALDFAELPIALRRLLGRCTVRWLPARGSDTPGRTDPAGDVGTRQMRLPTSDGGVLVVERAQPPFTPTEYARARAMVGLVGRLAEATPGRMGVRPARHRDTLTLPDSGELTVRRADSRDVAAARRLHARCSPETLRRRYRGPLSDADRYLPHLLSPNLGHTLAVETADGELVALGHLLWDGAEAEVALLVEDAWQRRGLGTQLLRRLTALAAAAGADTVYAVTQAANTPVAATMRRLGRPLEYQLEDATVVISARLAPASEPAEGHAAEVGETAEAGDTAAEHPAGTGPHHD